MFGVQRVLRVLVVQPVLYVESLVIGSVLSICGLVGQSFPRPVGVN